MCVVCGICVWCGGMYGVVRINVCGEYGVEIGCVCV